MSSQRRFKTLIITKYFLDKYDLSVGKSGLFSIFAAHSSIFVMKDLQTGLPSQCRIFFYRYVRELSCAYAILNIIY